MERVTNWVVAGFESRQEAERAADHLLELGFDEDDLVVAVRDHDYASAGGVMVRSEEQDPVAHLAHLIGLTGVPEDDANPMASRLDSADAVVAVSAEGRSDEARRVLADYGGEFDWHESAERPGWEQARDVLRGHWEQRADDHPAGHGRPWERAQAGYHYVLRKGDSSRIPGPAMAKRRAEAGSPAMRDGRPSTAITNP